MRSIVLSAILFVSLKAFAFDQDLYVSVMTGVGQVNTELSVIFSVF